MKPMSFEKISHTLIRGVLFLLLSCNLATAQSDELRRTLFKDADAALATAEAVEAAIYAPSTFAAGMVSYKKAEDDLQQGNEIKEIQKKISAASDSFTKSAELSQRSTAFFASFITARNEAKQAEAGQYAAETWKKAETRLADAIKVLESANDSAARAKGVESETAYREAALESIKLQCLGEARALLKKAEESGVKRNAPLAFDRSVRALLKAEKTLEENRHNTEEAKKLAGQALYETGHAIYLSQTINRLGTDKKTLEEMLLEAELPLQTMANALGKTVRFDQGTEAATKEITSAIQGLK